MTDSPTFWPRSNRYSWREVVRAIAGDLVSSPLCLDGAIIETGVHAELVEISGRNQHLYERQTIGAR